MDEVDEAQQLVEDRLADALAAHRLRTQPRPGLITGFCCDCGDPIEPERRAALPFARRCVDCQDREETRGKLWA